MFLCAPDGVCSRTIAVSRSRPSSSASRTSAGHNRSCTQRSERAGLTPVAYRYGFSLVILASDASSSRINAITVMRSSGARLSSISLWCITASCQCRAS